MKPVTPFDNFPSFGNAGARQAPGDAKYAQGFLAADTLPAEWANYFFHGSTKGISDLNTAVRSIWLELNSVLTAYNITADASQTDQLYQAIEKRLRSLYPVGTVYQNVSNSTNPGDATMLGFGTWEQITDKFLAARGSTNIGASGGAWSYTLTSANIPQHTHGMQHYHDVDILHNHGITDPGHFHRAMYYVTTVEAPHYWGYPDLGQAAYRDSAEYANTESSTTGITINNVDNVQRYKRTGGSINADSTARTQTDAYGTANPTAISITPTYVGVYTWKRTA
jgi:hypothetical protein